MRMLRRESRGSPARSPPPPSGRPSTVPFPSDEELFPATVAHDGIMMISLVQFASDAVADVANVVVVAVSTEEVMLTVSFMAGRANQFPLSHGPKKKREDEEENHKNHVRTLPGMPTECGKHRWIEARTAGGRASVTRTIWWMPYHRCARRRNDEMDVCHANQLLFILKSDLAPHAPPRPPPPPLSLLFPPPVTKCWHIIHCSPKVFFCSSSPV